MIATQIRAVAADLLLAHVGDGTVVKSGWDGEADGIQRLLELADRIERGLGRMDWCGLVWPKGGGQPGEVAQR